VELADDISQSEALGPKDRQESLAGDGTQRTRREANPYEATQLRHVDTFALKIGELTPAGLVVGVGDVVPSEWALAGDATDASHRFLLGDPSDHRRFRKPISYH
jgi:hypothetical protein